MKLQTWLIAAVITVFSVGGVIGYLAWDQHQQLLATQTRLSNAESSGENLATDLDKARSELAAVQEKLDLLNRDKAALTKEKERLEREKEAVAQAQKNLENEMRNALQSKDITISELQGKLTVNILDRVMFDSGRAELKAEGQQLLLKLAAVLAKVPNRQVLVIGHTDNVPIRASRHLYASNWELSTARANAAVRFLSETAKVDPRHLGAVGFGEFRPVADNSTPQGRAQNRRIAIVILAQDFLAPDVALSPQLPR
jgi:chemotaxis protein MotB